MTAATHGVVRQAAVESAGVAGGLQQTAMNVGPVLGVAVATALMASEGDVAGPTAALSALVLAGAFLGRLLPGPDGDEWNDHRRSEDRPPVPERR
ncbi:hypothetical protein [Streptomyces nigra]|uniref:hypothetical protein n=1 Tax=Streptomyces nigra TaxID=1827580 RepID=UPI003CC67516